MKAHRHLRLVWPPPEKHCATPARSIAVLGRAGVGKTALVAALAGELLWRDEHVVLIDAAAPGKNSLTQWVEAGRPGVFEGVPLIRTEIGDLDRQLALALAEGGTALIDVGYEDSLEAAAAACRAARLALYVRWRVNEDGEGPVTLDHLKTLPGRHALSVVYNGLTRGDSLRSLRNECVKSGIGSFHQPAVNCPV